MRLRVSMRPSLLRSKLRNSGAYSTSAPDVVRAARGRLGLCALLLGLALSLTACTSEGDDSADDAAERLASGLSTGDLGDVPFIKAATPDVTAELDETVSGMDGVEPAVEVGEVEEDGDSATATLEFSWPIGDDGEAWTYESTANLTRSEGEWQVGWARELVEPSLGPGGWLDRTPITADRGDVLGAGGQVLVTERPVARLGIDRTFVSKAAAPASARALAQLVGIDVAPYVKAVQGAGDRAFVEAIVYRRREVPEAVIDGRPGIKGATFYSDTVPLAQSREFAAPILGTVGAVTAEMIKENPDAYEVGDVAGISGLQARYDEQLRGTDGVAVQAVAGNGNKRELFRVDPVAGKPLRLTLRADLQEAAESLLADVGPASAVVAVRPSDGAVLAAANGPGTEGLNIATFGQYAPGSTFKVVSSLALLRSGLTTETMVDCPATTVVDGKTFKNYSDYPSSGIGEIPLRTAVANSCNTAFIGARDRLDERALVDAAASLGLGIDHEVGFPAYFGAIEPPESETGAAANLIGQGTVLASPLTMASVIASVQAGERVVPWLVEGVEPTPAEKADQLTALSPEETEALRSMLRAVVTDGSGSELADVPGPPVIAKTGTAEFERDGRIDTHAWMIAARGDLAVAVFVERGESGSQTAGPILEAFLGAAG